MVQPKLNLNVLFKNYEFSNTLKWRCQQFCLKLHGIFKHPEGKEVWAKNYG